MKKKLLLLSAVALFFIVAKSSHADWFSTMTTNVSGSKLNEAKERVGKYCKAGNFNQAKCKSACSDYEDIAKKRPSDCNILKNPPQTAPAPVVAVKKTATLDSLAKLKGEWKTKRLENVSKFKAEKEKLKLEFKEKFTQEKCAKIQERVKSQEAKLDTAKEKHASAHANLVDRINKFIVRFDEKKLDTSAIKGHLAELQTKIEKFKDDYAAYSSKMEESRNITCGRSEGEFKGVMLETKALLKTVHADAADIREYVRTVIFPDLKALKAQMPKETVDQDDSEETKN